MYLATDAWDSLSGVEAPHVAQNCRTDTMYPAMVRLRRPFPSRCARYPSAAASMPSGGTLRGDDAAAHANPPVSAYSRSLLTCVRSSDSSLPRRRLSKPRSLK